MIIIIIIVIIKILGCRNLLFVYVMCVSGVNTVWSREKAINITMETHYSLFSRITEKTDKSVRKHGPDLRRSAANNKAFFFSFQQMSPIKELKSCQI